MAIITKYLYGVKSPRRTRKINNKISAYYEILINEYNAD